MLIAPEKKEARADVPSDDESQLPPQPPVLVSPLNRCYLGFGSHLLDPISDLDAISDFHQRQDLAWRLCVSSTLGVIFP